MNYQLLEIRFKSTLLLKWVQHKIGTESLIKLKKWIKHNMAKVTVSCTQWFIQTIFEYNVFIKLLCGCISDMRTPTPDQNHHYGGGWGSANIQYLICLRKHIGISWKDSCSWKIIWLFWLFHLYFPQNMHGKKGKSFFGQIFSWRTHCSALILSALKT